MPSAYVGNCFAAIHMDSMLVFLGKSGDKPHKSHKSHKEKKHKEHKEHKHKKEKKVASYNQPLFVQF